MTSHANRGKVFEELLERWHAGYAARGEADIVKRHPAHIRLRTKLKLPRGRYVAQPTSTGEPDFSGGVKLAGYAYAVKFDAKSTTGRRWSFDDLSPAQADALDQAHKCGTVTFLALSVRGERFVVPWAPGYGGLADRWREWQGRSGRAAPGEASIALEALRSGVCSARAMPPEGWATVVRDLLRRRIAAARPF